MSRFGNALAAGASGVLGSMAHSMDQRMEREQKANLQAERDKAEMVRARAILEMQEEFGIKREARVREAGMKEGREIDAEVESRMAARDAADIAKVNDPELQNLTREELAQMRTDPEARKQFGLLNAVTRKEELETRAGAAGKLGYSKAAEESRNLLRTEIQDERNANIDKNNERRADQAEKNAEFMQKYQMKREARMDRLAAAQLDYQKSRANKEDARADADVERGNRAATAKALDGVNADIKALSRDAADPMLAPEQKAIIDDQLAEARTEAKRYRTALAGAGLEGSKEPPMDYTGRTGWDSTSGDVYRAGVKVGKAKNEAEARALASGTPPKEDKAKSSGASGDW